MAVPVIRAPTTNAFINIFFIEVFSWLDKVRPAIVTSTCRIHNNLMALLVISECGTEFSQNGNLAEEGKCYRTIRALLEKNNRLTKVPFWNWSGETLPFCIAASYRASGLHTVSSCSRIGKYAVFCKTIDGYLSPANVPRKGCTTHDISGRRFWFSERRRP